MSTKIINTVREMIPEQKPWIDGLIKSESESEKIEYLVLKKIARVCIDKVNIGTPDDLASVQEIIKVITLLYNGGNQDTRNAIENEFLTEISSIENTAKLKEHLNLFPMELRKKYLKIILEN